MMNQRSVQTAYEDDPEMKKLISWVISSISHELRTPVTTILSSAELLEHNQEKWSEEQKRKHLHHIKKATLAIREILDSEDFSANLQKLADQMPDRDRVYQLCQMLLDDHENQSA